MINHPNRSTRLSVAAVYGDDAQYVDDNSAVAIESLPKTAWAALVEGCEGYLQSGNEPGIDCHVAATSETLDDFLTASRKSWNECRSHQEVEIEGLAAIYFHAYPVDTQAY